MERKTIRDILIGVAVGTAVVITVLSFQNDTQAVTEVDTPAVTAPTTSTTTTAGTGLSPIVVWVADNGTQWLDLVIDPILSVGDRSAGVTSTAQMRTICLSQWSDMKTNDRQVQTMIAEAPYDNGFRGSLHDVWGDFFAAMDFCSDGDLAATIPLLQSATEAMDLNNQIVADENTALVGS